MTKRNAPANKAPESNPSPPNLDTRFVIGGLRLRSGAGAWLLFAVVLLLVGIYLTAAGYWNIQPRRQTVQYGSTGRTSSEKLRLIGPVIIGVALFNINCANALLHINRNMELENMKSKWQRYSPSKPFSQANSNRHKLDCSETYNRCVEEGSGIPTLECSSSSLSICSSSQVNLEIGSPGECRTMETSALPVIKLNDQLLSHRSSSEWTYRKKDRRGKHDIFSEDIVI
ncbi:transmembrane protein 200B isoform X2 [Danio aesculapii]|nr:transmembrane protein 200B isoform X2 [Danio aesculapii]